MKKIKKKCLGGLLPASNMINVFVCIKCGFDSRKRPKNKLQKSHK